MEKVVSLLLALGLTSSSFAALPPVYQSIREYNALLNSPELASHLTSGETISKIERHTDHFEVRTPQHKMDVLVVYEEQQSIGPVEFHLEFLPPEVFGDY